MTHTPPKTAPDQMVISQACGCLVGVGSGHLDYCRVHAAAPAMREALEDLLTVGKEAGFNTWPGDTGSEYRQAVERARALLRAMEGTP